MYQTIKGAALSCLAAPFVFAVPHRMIDEMSDAAEADKQAGLSCFYLRKRTEKAAVPLFFYVYFTFLCSGRSVRIALRQRSCCGQGQRRHHHH